MSDISIDFHALPEEQRDFIKECISKFGIHVVGIRFPPYQADEIRANQLDEVFGSLSPYNTLVFMLSDPILPAKGNMDFGAKNPDCLWLDIGKMNKNGLVEAGLSARTDNALALTIWKKVANRLKEITKKGALAVQADTGATGSARTHRYTSGAKALEDEGITMLTITGNILKLGQV